MKPALTHRESRRPTLPARRLPVSSLMVLCALSALLLAGCSSRGSETSTVGTASGGAPAQDSAGVNSAPGAKPGAPAAPGAPSPVQGSKSGAPVPSVGPKLTKSASLDLQVKNIDAAATLARNIATGLQAQVLSEQIGTGNPPGPMPLQSKSDVASGFGTLTLSVPADNLDAALDQISKQVGRVLRRNVSTQDVTAQYVDTESRLKTMRASVERVRALMAQAKDIGQVVALEGELSQREADLESLESQLGALKSSVERSTLTVSLSTPANEHVTETGFVAGLRSGWDAFTRSVAGLLTGIGAVLPFAVFFALVAAPIVWWLRRRRAGSASEVGN
jgi:hypothetical protein